MNAMSVPHPFFDFNTAGVQMWKAGNNPPPTPNWIKRDALTKPIPAANNPDWAGMISGVADRLADQGCIGKFDMASSRTDDRRYGSNGSLSVNPETGQWFSHEHAEGGGTTKLVQFALSCDKSGALSWLEREGFLPASVRCAKRDTSATQLQTAALRTPRTEVARYEYVDEQSLRLFDVVRFDPKTFRQFLPDQSHGSVSKIRRVLYRLDRLASAPEDRTVYLCEGEKDVHALEAWGLLATTAPGGSTAWQGKYAPGLAALLQGRRVAILPDHDEAGRKGARGARDALRAGGAAAAVIVPLEGLPDKGDVSDWLADGHTLDELEALARHAFEDGGAEPEVDSNQQEQNAKGGYSGLIDTPEFLARREPPRYILDGVIMANKLYSLTGFTGHAKTSLSLLLALAIATGKPFAGREVEQGGVLFLAGENPDNIRDQWLALLADHGVDTASIPVHWHEGRFRVDQAIDELLKDCLAVPDLRLIVADTLQAFFPGDNDNDNMQMLEAARQFRPLCHQLPTRPAVLIPCHPSGKSASKDSLLPRGGGAFLNEVDGNLTVWKSGAGQLDLHKQGKFRGPHFQPLHFKVEEKTFSEIVDARGRQIPMSVARELEPSEIVVTLEPEDDADRKEYRALSAIYGTEDIKLQHLGDSIGVSKSTASKHRDKLIEKGLVEHCRGGLRLTEAGKARFDGLSGRFAGGLEV